ncbi:hypothetical protein JR316_0009081 [Psilocybe cubensis]|uniref:Uncharacterized protein n=2 Tax=Psilocybe cubensis TaxID=181762 RepID=A0ACB8GUC3_PSICU|nr:hypothetical protein JR316_0009081 [Psilocybe cubensis]KAH9478624.1 hypothetical protein JR316_0009081 [Psilocybe cubensis]
MPRKPAFTPKPPVEKLPLAVRKDLRDNYESKKGDYETEIADVLGFPIAINIDVNAVWAYAETLSLSSEQAGRTFTGYIEGFINGIKTFVEKYGDLGKEYFQNAVTEGQLTVTVNELGDAAPTIDADVKDGVFRILFKDSRLGYNQSWLNDSIGPAIDKAPHEGFGLFAQYSIKTSYEEEVEEVQEDIGKILNMSDVVLDPNFEDNYAILLAKKEDTEWQKNFGEVTLLYFKNLKDQLTSQGFDQDDMLQEGLAETLTSKTFKIRVVEKTKSGNTIETVLEDGTCFIQTFPARWYYNLSNSGAGLVDML